MAKEIQIVEQKYLKQGINGFDFSIFPADYVNNLAGLVMQKIKLIQKFRVQWRSTHIAPNSDPSNIQWETSRCVALERKKHCLLISAAKEISMVRPEQWFSVKHLFEF